MWITDNDFGKSDRIGICRKRKLVKLFASLSRDTVILRMEKLN